MEFEDIQKLIDNNISEGWFIEYKEQFPKNEKIAKSISSFANSEGGWYIVGIKEKENQSGPTEIVGIDLEKNRKPADRVTNVVKDSVSPIPYFDTQIISIPNSDNVVLVVFVPSGNEPPYISNGNIFVRVGETTNPIKDRYEYDKLVSKRENFKNKLNLFSENRFTFSFEQKHSNQPYMECFIFADNFKYNLFDDFYSREFFDKLHNNFNTEVNIITEEIDISPFISFSNHYSSVDSHILRSIGDNNSYDSGLILEIFREGHLKLILPFNTYSAETLNKNYEDLYLYESLFSEDEKENLTVIDCAESIIFISTILEQYKRLLREYGFDYNLYIKLKFKNFWRVTPFFYDEGYLEHIHNYGLPINLKDELEVPLNGEYSKLSFDEFDVNNIFMIFIQALGFPFHLIESIGKGFSKYLINKTKNND